jgi:hypothetical protein
MKNIAETFQTFVGKNVRDPRDFLDLISYAKGRHLDVKIGWGNTPDDQDELVHVKLDDKYNITDIHCPQSVSNLQTN